MIFLACLEEAGIGWPSRNRTGTISPNVFFKQMGRPARGRCGNFECFGLICVAQREPGLSHQAPH